VDYEYKATAVPLWLAFQRGGGWDNNLLIYRGKEQGTECEIGKLEGSCILEGVSKQIQRVSVRIIEERRCGPRNDFGISLSPIAYTRTPLVIVRYFI